MKNEVDGRREIASRNTAWANIIARKLGLSDKQEVDHTNAGKEFKGFNFLPYTEDAEKVK